MYYSTVIKLPYDRSHPERNVDPAILHLANTAQERYGKVWMSDELLATLEYLPTQLPNGRGTNFLEIGSAHGGSFACWAPLFDGLKISVDLSDGSGCWAGDATRRHTLWSEDFDHVHSVIGDSTSYAILDQVTTILDGQLLDWLFIDGNHDYEPTKSDYIKYSPFVRPGGLIGFHDINHHGHQNGCGRFWKELVGDKWEIDWHWAGIGILHTST